MFFFRTKTSPPPPLSGIIHDLANPLTVLALSIEQLKNNARIRNTEAKRHIDRAFMASKKMMHYISTAKKQIGEREIRPTCEISKEISSAMKLLRPLAKKSNIRIKYRSPRAVFISGESVKFFRIISNLIANAIDAYASYPTADPKTIIIRVKNEKKSILVSVRDFGCGIPKHLHQSIFEPFYTTKRVHEGAAGLGLSIVKNIVENDFKGKIKIESTPGRGSVFTITIPNYV